MNNVLDLLHRAAGAARLALALTLAATTVLGAACLSSGGGASSAGSAGAARPTGGSASSATAPSSPHNLIHKDSFEDGKSLPWQTSFTVPADGRAFTEAGEYCVEVKNKGTNRWDAQFRHREMVIEKGHDYAVQFKIRSTQPIRAYLKVGMSGPPHREYFKKLMELTPAHQTVAGTFTMNAPDDPTAEFAFHIGGQLAATAKPPYTVCVDEIHLEDPTFTRKPPVEKAPIPSVLVNQTGYFPKLAKIATVKGAAGAKWELIGGGNVVASGNTIPLGSDPSSGEQVSVADFSAFTKEGSGYALKVGADTSHPFDIRSDIYQRLKYDALAYFYHNRSGIEIKMPFAGEPQWARPAGHVGEKPNKGDNKVPCVADSGCSYTLDVTGGWYDAGDHGKYVVNAGISVWTLLNWWERAKHLGSSAADFGDGKLNIPEKKNGVPDLLDEVRWELDWELKMQVPEGEKLAGMVHHKVHDKEWTALGLMPHDDPIPRFLYPPSTAATLNLAANAAQAARIWLALDKPDKAFAAKCLAAAERAWKAAETNPAVYAKGGGVGGGPYDDQNVTDEFYWAAAELYITTKKPAYKEFLTKSPYWKQVPALSTQSGADAGLPTPMTWGNVQSLGSLSLAVVPGALSGAEIEEVRKNIAATADAYLDIAKKEGYRTPFRAGPKGYPWGSNSFVLNNLIVIALAHDFTRDVKYLSGVAEGMDYLMGRNPLDQSYVSGYGERPLENPHHRFWAFQANSKLPKVPPGVVSGGPNSGLEDPYVQAAGLKGCAPQKCFVDHIEAWSANEITINWNSPLAWVAAFLDEKGGGGGGGGASSAGGAASVKPAVKEKAKGKK
jgi:endoglucanase